MGLGEPSPVRRRLTGVARRLLVLCVLALVFAAVPAKAQETSPVRLEASAGLAGYVDPARPIKVDVTISAEVLFAGELEARVASATQLIPVEVPAGGEKTYTVRVGLPVGSTQVRLRLYEDGATEAAATANLSLRSATDELIVGVVGSDELVSRIDGAAVAVTGRDVIAVATAVDSEEFGVARYIVMEDATELPPAGRDWLAGGGRLIVDQGQVAALGLDLATPISAGSDSHFPFGRGWVTGVVTLGQLTPADWSRIITPPRYQLAPREMWQSPEQMLMQSAVSGGDQRVPSLPWLLGALVGYAVLVGPINFAILRRLGKRELAWVTIPILAFLGVLGFWLAGRERLQTNVLNHGTVIVASEDQVVGRSATVLAVGTGGRRTLATPSGWVTYPFAATLDGSGMQQLGPPEPAHANGNGGFEFALDQLGSAGLQSNWRPETTSLPQVGFSADERQLLATVNNSTSHTFWAWGVVAKGRVSLASASLEPGDTNSESVTPGVAGQQDFGSVGDAVINERQLWDDPYIWNRISTLGNAASWFLDGVNSYFFGFTDDFTLPIDVDGRTIDASGSTLVVVPVDLTTTLPVDQSVAVSHLVDTGGASWVDYGPGYLTLQTRQMTVGWDLPASVSTAPALEVTNMFGEIPGHLEIFDWSTDAYESITPGDTIDLDRHRNLKGEVFLRASTDEPDNLDVAFETSMSPYGFSLEW
ncbi:MAG: hypothetical protein ACRDWA_11935 [Acidimicrobiia bacterium]